MSLSTVLRQYADSLAPSDGIQEKAREITDKIHKVFHENQEEKNYSIDRIVTHGSYAKKTSIWLNMDVDIIVVLNENIHRLDRIKNEMYDVILKELDENCKKGEIALKLHIDDLKVDVMLAANYVFDPDCREPAEVQVKNLLADLKEETDMSSEEKKNLSTASLSEGATVFERKHSAFSHALSRLAKFWSMTIGVPNFNRGRSSIMEYLGAWAAELEERNRRKDLLRGFRRFLEMVECSENLSIIWTMFYEKRDIPRHILSDLPVLLDPTSPYDNLLEEERREYLKQMSPFARETLKRLNEAKLEGRLDLKYIFDPQPRLKIIYRDAEMTPRDHLISSRRRSQLYPIAKNRSDVKGEGYKIAQSYYFAFINVAAADAKREEDTERVAYSDDDSSTEKSDSDEEGESIREKVKPEFAQFVSPGEWTSSSESHNIKDTTFTIPIGQHSNEVILISSDWE